VRVSLDLSRMLQKNHKCHVPKKCLKYCLINATNNIHILLCLVVKHSLKIQILKYVYIHISSSSFFLSFSSNSFLTIFYLKVKCLLKTKPHFMPIINLFLNSNHFVLTIIIIYSFKPHLINTLQ
jgi:hypothetical protein